MKIAFISSEVYPFSKTGGLADIAGALPEALSEINQTVKIFTPLYSSIDKEKFHLKKDDRLSGTSIVIDNKKFNVNIFTALLPGSNITVYFIDSPQLFSSENFYPEDKWAEVRFVLFQKATLQLIINLKWRPDILHINDWQSSLIPYYLKETYGNVNLFQNVASVLTIHNVGYQGLFPESTLSIAGIKPELFYPTGPAEFYGKVSYLKLGILYADIINTVSKTYAEELLTDEFSGGLKDVFLQRENDLYGIVNGVDYRVWNPETDKLIPQNYSYETLHLKEQNKIALAAEFGIPYHKDIPIMGIVSRMVSQKGFDLFFDLFDKLISMDAQLIVLGSGEEKYELFFKKAEFFAEENIKTHFGYNNDLAHLIEAGADIFLMPSLYEPCGLNQIYSLKYGSVPIVRNTGGLADTVRDWDKSVSNGNWDGNGFLFNEFKSSEMWFTITRALEKFKDKEVWKQIQINGMKEDFSWGKSAKEYLRLYELAHKKKM